jgi:elongation factor 1-gamma
VVVADEEFRKTPAYKAMTTTDKFPLLQTQDGCLHESTAIAKYFCSLGDGKMLGNGPVERSLVDQWISFCNTTLFNDGYVVCNGIFGWAETKQNDWNESAKNIKAQIKVLNTALEGKQWLVGDSITLADLIVGIYLTYMF